MGSDEEDEEKHSSDSDDDQKMGKALARSPAERKAAGTARGGAGAGSSSSLITPPESPVVSTKDVFGAVPFLGSGQAKPETESGDIFAKAPFRQASQEQIMDEFDVFTKAPFNRNLSRTNKSIDAPVGQTPPVSPDSVDVFGCSPFQPGHSLLLPAAAEDVFGQVPFEESSSQQQKTKQRSLQKLSSRQRRTKQETSNSNGKRHHGTPTSGRKTGKSSFRTPERVRRPKRVGRRDSQSSNEFLSASDSKENISVSAADVKDKGAALAAEEVTLDPFGAKPFHPQDTGWHSQHQGDIGCSNGRPRATSLQSTFSDGNKMDDFGAVPFTEMVHGVSQQSAQVELDPFGAAPFPSKP